MTSGLHLYAVLSAPSVSELGAGMEGEPVSVVDAGGLVVAAGALAERPRATPERLRRHDLAIRALTPLAASLLPCRFGEWEADERSVARKVEARAEELRRMLLRVEGCEQMTLRIFGPRDPGAPAAGDSPQGPGTSYLRDRLRHRSAAAGPLAPLRERLAEWIRDERVERYPKGPLLATVSHLIPRGAAGHYRSALSEVDGTYPGYRLSASGPWPAYAFARESLI